jgi:group I intron endonuclease
MAIVYKITNRANDKSYIGHSVRTLEQRWKSHLSCVRQGSKFRFHSAIRKYGIDNWDLEILFENIDVDICKKKEEELIAYFDLMNPKRGYNAKPGGCGGWIVSKKNYESWRLKTKERQQGLGNGNSVGYTNEELLEIGIIICKKMGRIITHNLMVKECMKIGIRFPKSFRDIRFGGKYINYAKILEEKLNMKFEPYLRTDEHRTKLREANLGKIGSNKGTKVIIDSQGKRKHVKN